MNGRDWKAPALLPAVAVLGMLAGDVAMAQGTGPLQEMVVTAQRREENLQDVGISVTAFSDAQVQQMGLVNSVDVAQMTPNLNYTVPQGESSQINFFLRGVGLNDFADAQENPVAVYVDDVYKPAMGGLALQLFDVQRIEVLRGPQGALFGRNSTGGVIHYVTKRPTADFDAYADASIGSFDQKKVEAAIGGALTDGVMARLSAGFNRHDGWTRNRTPNVQDYNETDSIAGRAQLLFQPSDTLEVLLAGNYSKNDAAVGAWQHEASVRPDGNVSIPLPGGVDAFGYADNDGDPWAGDYDRPGEVEVENRGVQANITWTVGGLDITSITAYTNVDRLQQEDTDMNPFLAPPYSPPPPPPPGIRSFIAPSFAAETDTFSQELRVAGEAERLRWLAGVYYFDNEVDGAYDLNTDTIGFVRMDADYIQQTDSWDVFGQVEFDLAEAWTIIAGLRWTDEEKELDYSNIDTSGITAVCSLDPGQPGCTNGVPTPVTSWRPTPDHMILFNTASVGSLAVQDDSYLTGRLQVNWQVADDVMLYGSYSRGKKSAGFNNGFVDTTFVFGSNFPLETIPFGDETLDAYEIGVKSTVFSGTTRLNAATFYYDYKDFQTFQWLILNQVIFNTDAEVYGAEVEIDSRPIDGLTLQLGMGLLDATAEDIPTILGDARHDRDMVGAPDVSVNALVRYEWPALGGTLAVQGWGNWQQEIWYDIQNHPVSKEDGYTVVNFRTSYTSGDEAWEVYAYVNNAFEEEYKNYSFDFSVPFGFTQVAAGLPRWWGLGARVSF
ncbi:MAG: TonB-dependent receptor [Gammaproteobacteria bacterium]|nr:TonB-dependent receptor [Gammaproteobacteria bacterium]